LIELASIEKPARIDILTFNLQNLLSWLRKQPDAPRTKIAEYEYALLPIFRAQGRQQDELIIYEMLREDPAFFVSVVCDVYNPASGKSVQDKRSPEEIKSRALTADRVLNAWNTVPGVNGKAVDMEKLDLWIDSARRLLSDADRAEVGDQVIGRMLFRFPEDPADNVWPHIGLRQLLERVKSKSIENGIALAASSSEGTSVREAFAGGQLERNLQKKWQDRFAKLDEKWTRARDVCIAIADWWGMVAVEQDNYARRERVQFSR
jgi:hypothetical protein